MPSFGPVYVFVFLLYLFLLAILCLVVVHVAIAAAVYNDARKLKPPALGLSAWVWALLSFSVPAIGLLCYWLMNHSTLSRR